MCREPHYLSWSTAFLPQDHTWSGSHTYRYMKLSGRSLKMHSCIIFYSDAAATLKAGDSVRLKMDPSIFTDRFLERKFTHSDVGYILEIINDKGRVGSCTRYVPYLLSILSSLHCIRLLAILNQQLPFYWKSSAYLDQVLRREVRWSFGLIAGTTHTHTNLSLST